MFCCDHTYFKTCQPIGFKISVTHKMDGNNEDNKQMDNVYIMFG